MGAIVTTDSTHVHVDFNDIQNIAKYKKSNFRRSSILNVSHVYRDNGNSQYIEISITQSTHVWQVSPDGSSSTLPIASVDGVVPSDIDHLYELMVGIQL